MLTLITPTGDRPLCFSLCERWMAQQDYTEPYQWLVIDDGAKPTVCTMGQTHIRRAPSRGHTLVPNLRAALPHIEGEKILIIEDDDYYGRRYLSQMSEWLDRADLVGEGLAKYFSVRHWGWRRLGNTGHGSLCRTGFTRAVLGTLGECAKDDSPWIDKRLWPGWKGSKYLHMDRDGTARLCVGIKGMPGRPNATRVRGYQSDPKGKMLQHWTGDTEAVQTYRKIAGRLRVDGQPAKLPRVCVYTSIVGEYDQLRQPDKPNPAVDYVCFTDSEIDSPGWWQIRRIDPEFSPRLESRVYKTRPHVFLPDYDWWIWIDGNVRLRNDSYNLLHSLRHHQGGGRSYELYACRCSAASTTLDEAAQLILHRMVDADKMHSLMQRYESDGHRQAVSVAGGFLVRANTEKVRAMNERWWSELVRSGLDRDQIPLSYSIWREGVNALVMDHAVRERYVRFDVAGVPYQSIHG